MWTRRSSLSPKWAPWRFAERNRVVATGQFGFVAAIEPEAHRVHEVEAHRVHNNVPADFLLSAEEDCRGEDALKRSLDPAILRSVVGDAKIVEQSSRALEVNGAALLPEGHGGDQDGDQAVLPLGQTKSGMSRDLKEQVAIAPSVDELVGRRATATLSTPKSGISFFARFLSWEENQAFDLLHSLVLWTREVVHVWVGGARTRMPKQLG